MSKKFNKDLIRDFPFLVDLERDLGDLGHIRVNRISGTEIETVRGLPTATGVLCTELREYPSSNEDEGFLVVRASAEFDGEPVPYFTQTMIFKFKKEDDDPMTKGIKLVPVRETLKGRDLLLGHFVFSDLSWHSELPVGFIPANADETFYLDTFTVAPDASKVVVKIAYYLDDLFIDDETLTPAELGEKLRVDLNVIYLKDGSIRVGVAKAPTGFHDTPDFSDLQFYRVTLADNPKIIEYTSKVDFLKKIDLPQLKDLVGELTVEHIVPDGVLQLAVDFVLCDNAPATSTRIIGIPVSIALSREDYLKGNWGYIGVKGGIDAEMAKAIMEGRVTLVNNF